MKKTIFISILLLTGLFFQLQATAPDIEWARGAIGYEIFFRSFFDSDGDGYGDLNGITAKLDYLNDGIPGGNDLGIDYIWMTPIFASGSYHGYDTTDYYSIKPEYGTLADFQNLVAEADKRGIKIVLDLVLNHCSDLHPIFLEAVADRKSPKRDWFIFSKEYKRWKTWKDTGFKKLADDDYYWGTFGIPDWNAANPEVKKYLFDVAGYWLDQGVAGFRLDAIRHLIEVEKDGKMVTLNSDETLAWLHDFSDMVRKKSPGALLIGEVWDSPINVAKYSNPDLGGLTAGFNFTAQGSLLKSLDLGAHYYIQQLQRTRSMLHDKAIDVVFSGNHDMERIAEVIDDPDKQMVYAAAFMLTPGGIMIYYGDEIGQLHSRKSSGHPLYRTAMAWSGDTNAGFSTAKTPRTLLPKEYETRNVEDELADTRSLLNYYISLSGFRQKNSDYGNGKMINAGTTKEVLRFWVLNKNLLYLSLVNFTGKSQPVILSIEEWFHSKDIILNDKTVFNMVFPLDTQKPVTVTKGKKRPLIRLKPYQAAVFKVSTELE